MTATRDMRQLRGPRLNRSSAFSLALSLGVVALLVCVVPTAASAAKSQGSKAPKSSAKRTKPKPDPGAKTKASSPGKALFTAKQCVLCHAVKRLKLGTPGGAGPDLSKVGARYTPKKLTQWLQRRPTPKGKVHPFPFTGTPQELKGLVAWLLTLK